MDELIVTHSTMASIRTPTPELTLSLPNPEVPLALVHDKALVFNVDHIKQLRSLGILGLLLGTLPLAPQQNVFLGVPLQLSVYEVLWLLHHRLAYLYDSKVHQHLNQHADQNETTQSTQTQLVVTENETPLQSPPSRLDISDFLALLPNPSEILAKYRAFNKIKNDGFYIQPGLRFGGDFVAYPGDPLRYHSHLIVTVVKDVDCLDLVAAGRLATTVKKVWLIIGEKEKNEEKNDEYKENIREETKRDLEAQDIEDIQESTQAQEAQNLLSASEQSCYSIEWAGFG